MYLSCQMYGTEPDVRPGLRAASKVQDHTRLHLLCCCAAELGLSLGSGLD